MNAPDDPRLQRLESYLREDPGNPHLLADACEAALAAGDVARAQAHLEAAQQRQLRGSAWTHRWAHLALLQQDWPAAIAHLQALEDTVGAQAGIAHDLAFAHLHAGDPQRCRDLLAPWAGDPALDPHTRDAVQVLWLRATHRLGLLDEAWALVATQREAGGLQPGAAGVASLVALDLGRFADCRLLAARGLEAQVPSHEAVVARACVALAEGDWQQALALLRRTVEGHPADGRSWSALGMASLQARDLVAARSQFARASQLLPGHVGTWHGLGWSCLLLQDRAGALAAFQQALQLDPNFAESHGAVGLVLMLAGREEEAEHHLSRADRLDRKNVTARYARALRSGHAQDAAALRQLAGRLLDRPGFFGGKLADIVQGGHWQAGNRSL